MDASDRVFVEELFVKQSEEFQRYFGAILEKLDHDTAMLAERYRALFERLESTKQRLANWKSRHLKH